MSRVHWRRGSVTIEAAFAFAALITLVAAVVWGLALVGKEIAAIDAAGSIARQAAREPDPDAHSWHAQLPPGGAVELSVSAQRIRATVTIEHPGHQVSAVAVAYREPQ